MNYQQENFKAILSRNPVIPAVKDDATLRKFLNSQNEIVFILHGDILTLNEKVDAVIAKGKIPFVHLDMVQGLASNAIVLDYFYKHFGRNCGIITTKSNMAKKAMEHGIRVVQRFFMLDSLSIESALDGIAKVRTDAIEIMPGIIPRVIHQISQKNSVPIIAGGLIQTELDVEKILAAGAVSISTSKTELWKFGETHAKPVGNQQ
jgi:glycerol uptake operon antiterminator